MSSKRRSAAITLLTANNVVFLSLYVVLCFYNRFSLDDFHFLNNLASAGIWDATWLEWETWSTRWASVLVNHSIHILARSTPYAWLIFGIINLLLFIGSTSFLMQQVRLRLGMKPWSVSFVINMAIFTSSAFFYATFKIDETWFWLCATCSFLLSVPALLAGAAWLIGPRGTAWKFLVGIMSFIYVGGSNGPLSLIVILALIVVLIWQRVERKRTLSPPFSSVRLSLALLGCGLSFALLYIGPGNRVRESLFEEIGLLHALGLNFKTTGIIVLMRLPSTLVFAALFSLPVVYFASMRSFRPADKNWRRKLILLTCLYFATIYFYQLPITYKTQDVAAYRALFPITPLTVLYVASIFWILSNRLLRRTILAQYAIFGALGAILIMNLYMVFSQQAVVANYAAAYDHRMKQLQNSRFAKEKVVLRPLPEAGLLLSAEISTDSAHFSNRLLQVTFKLQSPIVRELADGEDAQKEWQPASMKNN